MIGTVLAGRYRVTGLLGGGGMAVVYKATDQVTGDTVAVKALRSEYVADGAFLRRLRREAEAVRRLSHPGVVAVLDVGEDAGQPFLVLEYVEGVTLKQYIRERHRYRSRKRSTSPAGCCRCSSTPTRTA